MQGTCWYPCTSIRRGGNPARSSRVVHEEGLLQEHLRLAGHLREVRVRGVSTHAEVADGAARKAVAGGSWRERAGLDKAAALIETHAAPLLVPAVGCAVVPLAAQALVHPQAAWVAKLARQ